VLGELALGALRAEHRQAVVNVEIRPPLVGWVLVLARLAAALGADEITRSDHHARLIVVESAA
jgi:hypothetical protein